VIGVHCRSALGGGAVSQTIFIIDDEQAARDSLTFLFRAEGLTCRGYASGPAFLEQLREDEAGCVVTDVRMPEMDGLTLVRTLRGRGCRLPVVVITGHADVTLAVQAMKEGVSDFIEKPFEREVILGAVKRALEASLTAEAQAAARMVVQSRVRNLTERERQVHEAVTEGLSNKVIAQNLAISPRTVEIYRANVMSKMQASSLSELVRMHLMVRAG